MCYLQSRFYHGDYHQPPAQAKCVLFWLSQVSVSSVPGICRRGEALGLPHCCLLLSSRPHTPYQVFSRTIFWIQSLSNCNWCPPTFQGSFNIWKGTRFPHSKLMMEIYSPNMFWHGLTESPGWAACMVWTPGGGGVGVGREIALCILVVGWGHCASGPSALHVALS